MPDYRAHLVGSDGHFHKLIVLDAPDDAAAIAATRLSVDGHDVELWKLTARSANSNGRNNPEHLGDFLRTCTEGAATAAERGQKGVAAASGSIIPAGSGAERPVDQRSA